MPYRYDLHLNRDYPHLQEAKQCGCSPGLLPKGLHCDGGTQWVNQPHAHQKHRDRKRKVVDVFPTDQQGQASSQGN
jgi:hypothetical protein